MTSFHSLKLLAVLALLFAAAVATPCSGAVTVTAAEVGSNVVFTYSGSIANPGTFIGTTSLSTIAVRPSNVGFQSFTGDLDYYQATFTPNTGFGTGSTTSGTSRTGSAFGFDATYGYIHLPSGYSSGTISGTATFNNTTITGLGLTPGNYSYAINGSDNIFVNISASSAPEPARALLVCLGLTGLVCRRRRQD